MQPYIQRYMQPLCQMWLVRAKDLGMKGKARDNECISYFCGAMILAQQLHPDFAKYLSNMIGLIIGVHGHKQVEMMATDNYWTKMNQISDR